MDSVDRFFMKDLQGHTDWGSQVTRRSFSDARLLVILLVGTPTIRHMKDANQLLDRPELFVREAYCQNSMRQKLSSFSGTHLKA